MFLLAHQETLEGGLITGADRDIGACPVVGQVRVADEGGVVGEQGSGPQVTRKICALGTRAHVHTALRDLFVLLFHLLCTGLVHLPVHAGMGWDRQRENIRRQLYL